MSGLRLSDLNKETTYLLTYLITSFCTDNRTPSFSLAPYTVLTREFFTLCIEKLPSFVHANNVLTI